jgi:hypothetical protein
VRMPKLSQGTETNIEDHKRLMSWAIFRDSACAIRASSCVNVSNLCGASSMSRFPISLLKYLTERTSVETIYHSRINSLIVGRLISFVAIARIESTSAMISMIIRFIAIVGGTSV